MEKLCPENFQLTPLTENLNAMIHAKLKNMDSRRPKTHKINILNGNVRQSACMLVNQTKQIGFTMHIEPKNGF